jgi:nicotinamide riboside transporter PnuC
MKLKKNVSRIAAKARDYYEIVGWCGAGLILFGYYLNANQYLSCWVTWTIGNIFIAGYSAHKKAYPTMMMSIIIAIMNIYGYYSWR